MQDANPPTYETIYRTPYDQLKKLSVKELEELIAKIGRETRQALLAHRWLEGILRHKQTESVS
jgi:hypothetical protein